jgi:hypothetical protein
MAVRSRCDDTPKSNEGAGVHAQDRVDQRLFERLQVAEVIYAAATDETDRLRYVATEDIALLVAA